MGKLLTKQLIWAEIETLQAIEALARYHDLSEHPFMKEFLFYKAKIEADLMAETEDE